jgi:predicted N-acyltransferase
MMKYTLFAFQLYETDLKDQRGQLNELGQLLGQTTKYRADISYGVYVFDTQKGWRDIHRLRQILMYRRTTFAELPFDEALGGFLPLAIRGKLQAVGINDDALLNLSE